MILLIDNYDSFTFNLARYMRRLGADVRVVRNDDADVGSIAARSRAIVISPGPCGPEQAGQSIEVVQRFSGKTPILGICLGHQVICHAFGGRIVRAARPIHGRALPIGLDKSPLFENMGPVTRFARYHSLVAELESLPSCLQVIARSLPEPLQELDYWSGGDPPESSSRSRIECGEIMAVQHKAHLTYGVQFHPESILSTDGYHLLANFLSICRWPVNTELPDSDLHT